MKTLAAFVFGAMLVTMLTTTGDVRDAIIYVVGAIAWFVVFVACGLTAIVLTLKEWGR